MIERLLEINPQIRPGPEVIDSNEIESVTLLNLSAPPPQQTTELFEFLVAQVKFDPSERDEYWLGWFEGALSCPESLFPMQIKFPVVFNPQACDSPADMVIIVLFSNPVWIWPDLVELDPQQRIRLFGIETPQEKPTPDEIDRNLSFGGFDWSESLQHFKEFVPLTVAQICLSPTERFSSKTESFW